MVGDLVVVAASRWHIQAIGIRVFGVRRLRLEEFRLLEKASHGSLLMCLRDAKAVSGVLGPRDRCPLTRRLTELFQEVLMDLFV